MTRGNPLPVASFAALADARAQFDGVIAQALVRFLRSDRHEDEAGKPSEVLRVVLDAVRAVARLGDCRSSSAMRARRGSDSPGAPVWTATATTLSAAAHRYR